MKDINVTGTDHTSLPDVSEYISDGKLIIPEGVEYVLEEACHEREDLEEIYLPNSMRVIGPIAFAECPNLRKVVLNAGLEEIGDGAFLGAMQMTEIKLPESLKTIGPMAFYACGFSEISIPESVEFIGENCFWECVNLTKADVLNPSCVIEDDAFGECPNLVQGYMAPGFPKNDMLTSNLLFSMLWLTSYDRHEQSGVMVDDTERQYYTSLHVHMDEPRARLTVGERAQKFIEENSKVVLEQILKTNNTAAMRGIIEHRLFDADTIEVGLQAAVAAGQTELSSLFLSAKGQLKSGDDTDEFSEFEL
ncbi:MAG: leucine-rich repeat domain-containing protein [Clostridiales bacterium]|nr:leucine-rich repeat domain-containing protein [Candidatus Crickella caballi]